LSLILISFVSFEIIFFTALYSRPHRVGDYHTTWVQYTAASSLLFNSLASS